MNSFPKAKKIVYSTCSLFPEENERVISNVVKLSRAKWKVLNVKELLKDQWNNFGSGMYGEMGTRCLYARPDSDLTTGFFLAVLERDPKQSNAEGEVVEEKSNAQSQEEPTSENISNENDDKNLKSGELKYKKKKKSKECKVTEKTEELQETPDSQEECKEKKRKTKNKKDVDVDNSCENELEVADDHDSNQPKKRKKKKKLADIESSITIENRDSNFIENGGETQEEQQQLSKMKRKKNKKAEVEHSNCGENGDTEVNQCVEIIVEEDESKKKKKKRQNKDIESADGATEELNTKINKNQNDDSEPVKKKKKKKKHNEESC